MIDNKKLSILYEEFKKYNLKEQLVEKVKKVFGLTSNFLQTGWILEDGSLVDLGKVTYSDNKRRQYYVHGKVIELINGLDNLKHTHKDRYILSNLFLWCTNSIRVYVRPNYIKALIWVNEEITSKQWSKLDLIISCLKEPFHYDIIVSLEPQIIHSKIEPHARNSLSMKGTYLEKRIQKE